jgi:leader peptidase (prepilin peptidase)/N-methyltransferase
MDPLLATIIFVFGLAFGSFLNVCIHRIPRRIDAADRLDEARVALAKLGQTGATEPDAIARQSDITALEAEVAGFSIVHPHSACPKCHEPIRPYDNIPVVSWLLLRGRCRHCHAPISPRYMVVELLTAITFIVCLWRFHSLLVTAKFCIFSFLIIGLTFIDAEWRLLPDAFTLPGIVIGLLFSLVLRMDDLFVALLWASWPGLFGTMNWRVLSLIESVAGAFIGAGFFYLIAIAYKTVRGREGMGLGDVKLMAMVGAFLGVRLTIMTIFAASLIGSLFGLATILVVWKRRTERRMTRSREPHDVASRRAWKSAKLMYRFYGLPFGVFLGPMALASVFFANAIFTGFFMFH